MAKLQFLGRTLCRGPTKIGQAGNNISVVQTVWRGRRICTVSHGEHWSVEAVELILHELRPKWRLRRLHGVCGGYMSRHRKQFLGRTLCRGPTNIGQAGNNISVGQPVWRGVRECTVMGNTEAWKQLNWYSTNSDLSGRLRRLHGVCGGYMSTLRKQFLGRTLCRGPTKKTKINFSSESVKTNEHK